MKIESERSVSLHDTAPVLPPPVAAERTVASTADGRPVIVERAVAAEPVPVVAARAETVRTVRTSGFVPATVVAGAAAMVLLVLGGVTVARAGIDGPLGDPVVRVAGFTATAWLGLIELGFGLALLAGALARDVRAVLFVGICALVASLVAVFQPSVGGGSLALERSFAVWATVVSALIVVSALLPTFRTSSARHTTVVD